MANFTQIIQEINDDINTNGVGAITGAKLNEVLRDMIAAVNAEKQDPLTIDATPTEDSTNPVQSGGVYEALQDKLDKEELYIRLGFPVFDASLYYSQGDLVVYNGDLYVFTAAHHGQWDANDVEYHDINKELKDLYVDLAEQIDAKQDTISDLATIRSGAALGATSIQSSEKGAASGVATLDSGGKVPQSQLPSYVDDVLEYANLASFPATGESGKIYVALDTNKTYRWGGSAYVEISQSLALGETSSTAFPGDRGKAIEDKIPSSASSSNKLATNEDVNGVNLLVEQSSLTDQQRNTALANVSNQTANSTTGKMGYKVLDPTKTFAQQVTAENTIYEIRDVFDLNGGSITIPSGSVLRNCGGSIKNGTINCNNCTLAGTHLIDDNITLSGKCSNQYLSSEIFKTTKTSLSYVVTKLLAIAQTGVTIDIERDLTANIDMSQIEINDDIILDFHGKSITCAEKEDGSNVTNLFHSRNNAKPLSIVIKNLTFSATANITKTGQFSGLTSNWGFVYFQNIRYCLIENVNLLNFEIGIKFGKESSSDILENISIKNCVFHGKMSIQYFAVKRGIIENCYFNGENATNSYDHALYCVSSANIILDNNYFTKYRDVINFYNSASSASVYDLVNISVRNSVVSACSRFLSALNVCNLEICNTYFDNYSNSDYQIIWLNGCRNAIVSDLNFDNPDVNLKSESGGITVTNCFGNISFNQINIKASSVMFYLYSNEGNVVMSNMKISTTANNSSTRFMLVINSRCVVADSDIDFGTEGGESFFAYTGSVIKLQHTKFTTNSSTSINIVRCDGNPNSVSFENCIINDKISLYSKTNLTYKYPKTVNIIRDGILLDDYPFSKSGTSDYRNAVVVNIPIGYTFYDTTLNKEIVWNGTAWVNLDGTALS